MRQWTVESDAIIYVQHQSSTASCLSICVANRLLVMIRGEKKNWGFVGAVRASLQSKRKVREDTLERNVPLTLLKHARIVGAVHL